MRREKDHFLNILNTSKWILSKSFQNLIKVGLFSKNPIPHSKKKLFFWTNFPQNFFFGNNFQLRSFRLFFSSKPSHKIKKYPNLNLLFKYNFIRFIIVARSYHPLTYIIISSLQKVFPIFHHHCHYRKMCWKSIPL